ncbi:MAG: hypothetical protein OXF62_01125, partial [Caldilineaceae bacterium]|nr:hypothetical protein [Caldilineaceae bacterium]
LTNLTSLGLAGNRLSGEIPAWLVNIVNLTDLHISGNLLSGCVPAALRDAPNNDLAFLDLPDCDTPTLESEERAALVALYEATDGANWTHSANWLSDAPVAAWYGVVTDASGRVTELNLPANGLIGSIPDLSALTRLKYLDLGYNRLSGFIPDMSALVGLSWLSLDHNQLTGPVPDLSALTGLSRLFLGANGLTGPVPDLSTLTSLTHLDLGHNQLTGPVPDLSALASLSWLDLRGNLLCLPEGAVLSGANRVAAVHLQRLSLPACPGTRDPPPPPPPDPGAAVERDALVALYEATDGASWTHSANWLSAAPVAAWYGVVTDASGRVTELNLPANGLIGSIPDLSALSSLKYLDLGFNRLSGFIPDMSALVGLSWLSLDHNQLTGPVPDLSALTGLSRLFLGANGLTGPVPDLSTLTGLTHLDLGFNQLTGPIPDLSALTSLSWLDLGGNLLCLPEGAALSGPNGVAVVHLHSLNLPACTAVAESGRREPVLSAYPHRSPFRQLSTDSYSLNVQSQLAR